jgi:hypothetical protein
MVVSTASPVHHSYCLGSGTISFPSHEPKGRAAYITEIIFALLASKLKMEAVRSLET